MLWTLESMEHGAETPENAPAEGRFVLHQHRDGGGAHLDLRLEEGAALRGWRIDAETLASGAWAEEKAPHRPEWLDDDHDARRLDAGLYRWESRDADGGVLLLRGGGGARRLAWRREPGLSAACLGGLLRAARELGRPPEALPGLLRDGGEARSLAVSRLCALGRELDGASFDAAAWRALLEPLDLRGVQRHLAAFEARLDRLHPPMPVSRPEPLETDEDAARDTARRDRDALAIARSAKG